MYHQCIYIYIYAHIFAASEASKFREKSRGFPIMFWSPGNRSPRKASWQVGSRQDLGTSRPKQTWIWLGNPLQKWSFQLVFMGKSAINQGFSIVTFDFRRVETHQHLWDVMKKVHDSAPYPSNVHPTWI